MFKIKGFVGKLKQISMCELFEWFLAISCLFLFIVSTIVFPIVHLNKAVPLQSEFEDAFNDVCDCVEIANLLQLGPRRTALGKECIAMYNNPIFDDIAPVEKFFGHTGYRPSKYDDRADILNNVTAQYRPPIYTPPPGSSGESSDSGPCDGNRFDGFRAGIAFCFISLILVLFICPAITIYGNWTEIKEYFCGKVPAVAAVAVAAVAEMQPAQVEIEMNPHIEEGTPELPPLVIGAKISVLDTVHKWLNAKIIDRDLDYNRIKVTYIDFSSRWDEWINLNNQSHRIRPIGKF